MRPLSIRTRLTLSYTGALVAILIVISGVSYSLLRWTIVQDADHSLLAVGEVIQDAGYAGGGLEAKLREILGPEVYDQFFQVVSPEGQPGYRSSRLHEQSLPLSRLARENATRGRATFETIPLGGQRVRLLTLPVVHGRRLAQIIQVGLSLRWSERALRRYLEGLFVLVPVGVALAASGGALMARAALRPVDEMSRMARRITAENFERRIGLRGIGDELDRLAETLNDMLGRLASAFQEMRRFSADAAHELRTPLTALKGTLEVALRAERSAGEYRGVLAGNLEEVERLIRLAEDLLLLSRSEAGLEGTRSPVDLEPLVLDVCDVAVRLASGVGVSVKLREVVPATVLGDALALERAVLNLVENPVKYTPAGGTVELALERLGNTARLSVSDTGPGIAPADAERIFEPFVRLDPGRGRETGGAGLGLSIARSIVVAHRGTLALRSTPGQGSRFTISLPLERS